jgi:ABC-type multidrug transport system permease subunit
MSRPSPFFALYLTRLREFYRQPARIFWVYGFPTMLAIVLGLAFKNRPPETVFADLIDAPGATNIEAAATKGSGASSAPAAESATATKTESSTPLSSSPAGSKPGDRLRPPIVFRRVSPEVADKRVKTGKAALVVEPGPENSVIYRYDATRPEANTARQAINDAIQEAAGRTDPVAVRDELITEPGSRYIDFLIPGLIGLNAMGGGLWGIGFLLVNYRIGKLLKCLVATPMPRRDFLGAILAARLTFLIPDLTVLLLLGTLMFQMPIRGNLGLLILVDILGALAFAGIGLLIASRAKTTETVSGLMNLVMLPMWLFSGVFFSSERFPDTAQPFIQALPLTQLVNALRAVILEGAGLIQVAPAMLILTAWTVVTFFLALRLFRWT